MAWQQKRIANPGEYLLARTAGGLSIDLFGAISNLELMQRLQNYANGWIPVSVRFERGLFSGDIVVLAQAQAPVDMAAFAADVENAINSFWAIMGVTVSAWASPDASADPPGTGNSTASSIRWLAVAAIAVAAAIAIVQIRKVAT